MPFNYQTSGNTNSEPDDFWEKFQMAVNPPLYPLGLQTFVKRLTSLIFGNYWIYFTLLHGQTCPQYAKNLQKDHPVWQG